MLESLSLERLLEEPLSQDDGTIGAGSEVPGSEVPGSEITVWLERWRGGDRGALAELVPLLYRELREVARRTLRRERTGHTLATTALVHEAYLRLLDQRKIGARNRVEFLAVAGHTMRRLLVDYARTRKREKRGGGQSALPLEEAEALLSETQADDLLVLDLALDRLAAANPRGGQVIELRFFAGLDLEETAQVLGVSLKTVQRDWLASRAWLRKELEGFAG